MKNIWKQKLHLEAEKGWINDPNGLSFFNDFYNVYFQYSPDSPLGEGRKCWGLWRSEDLIHWRFEGTVLYPDTPDDKDGVYSGCGLVKDGKLHIFYTGNVKEDGEHDYITSGRGANVITVTTEDGTTVSEKKTLLRNCDYPDFCSCHVRDPKVWEENGEYKMVLGARTLDDKGCVLFYRSDDLENWAFERSETYPDFGYMWECPDFFRIDSTDHLSVSPQGLKHEEFRFQNVYSSGYFLSEECLKDFEEWDYGFDFYAPQTFEAPDGRRIIIGWMGIGDIPYKNPTVELGYQHCLTIPREITAGGEKGKLLQNPVKEFETLRIGEKFFDDKETVKAELPCEIAGLATGDFTLEFSDFLRMGFSDGIFKLEFLDDKVGCGRTVRKVKLESCGNVRIIADMSSVEIYLNNGEKVLSTRFYPKDESVVLKAKDMFGRVYGLKGIEVKNLGE